MTSLWPLVETLYSYRLSLRNLRLFVFNILGKVYLSNTIVPIVILAKSPCFSVALTHLNLSKFIHTWLVKHHLWSSSGFDWSIHRFRLVKVNLRFRGSCCRSSIDILSRSRTFLLMFHDCTLRDICIWASRKVVDEVIRGKTSSAIEVSSWSHWWASTSLGSYCRRLGLAWNVGLLHRDEWILFILWILDP